PGSFPDGIVLSVRVLGSPTEVGKSRARGDRLDHVQISTTVRTKDDAMAIAKSIVESRLGACVQVLGPITSTYWWDGEVQIDEEWSCVARTISELTDRVLDHISDLHPYDNPELAVVPIVGGTPDYHEWISEEVSPALDGSEAR
ncbi:MAG: divalent-cation tolerance protein CutA, partial [Actinobacteria bacterium]|nr:divalent-cation tolerance protein CutA [Actinomycetota bacterium]